MNEPLAIYEIIASNRAIIKHPNNPGDPHIETLIQRPINTRPFGYGSYRKQMAQSRHLLEIPSYHENSFGIIIPGVNKPGWRDIIPPFTIDTFFWDS